MKRFLVISAILVFVVSPAIGWGLGWINTSRYRVDPTTAPLTNKSILDILRDESRFSTDTDSTIVDIVSHKRFHTWWYVAALKVQDRAGTVSTEPILLADFRNDPETAKVMSDIGPYPNVTPSGVGIPYEVIDEMRKISSGAHHE